MPTYTCAITGKDFELRPEDVAFSERMGVPVPIIEPDEMLRQAMSMRNEWNLYRRKCDKTGEDIIACYDTDVSFPVYKHDVWWGESWNAMDYGRGYDSDAPFGEQFKALQNKVPREGTSNVASENCDYNLQVRQSRNCYLSSLAIDSEDLYYSHWLTSSKDCVDCRMTLNSQLCYETINVDKCYECVMSQELFNCSNCYFSYQLRGCKDCIGCSNLNNKQYYVFNKKVTPEEYNKTKKQIFNGSYVTWKQGLEFYKKMWENAKHRAVHNLNCENVLGDVLYNCKNVYHGFEAQDAEDVAYSVSFGYGTVNDVWYSYSAGFPAAELIYNSCMNRRSSDIRYSVYSWDSSDLSYCDSCSSCKDCFGCVGIKHKQYCILNKQYTKEEYKALKAQIITSLGDEFCQINPWMSSYAYNETPAQNYFPLTKKEAKSRGYAWKESVPSDIVKNKKEKTGKGFSLPDSVYEIDDSICKEVLVCQQSGKKYQLIPQEISFYKKMGLPLPRRCQEVRRDLREKRKNPYRLFRRRCSVTGEDIWSSFSDDRPETVVCEEEYHKSFE